jgi:ABC-type Fe3+-siderophore transport system permease subunit
MSFEITSGAGAVLAIVVLSLLFFGWLIALFALLVDSISIGAKILWCVALTCLAPFAIPIYFVLRHRRHRAHPSVERSTA